MVLPFFMVTFQSYDLNGAFIERERYILPKRDILTVNELNNLKKTEKKANETENSSFLFHSTHLTIED